MLEANVKCGKKDVQVIYWTSPEQVDLFEEGKPNPGQELLTMWPEQAQELVEHLLAAAAKAQGLDASATTLAMVRQIARMSQYVVYAPGEGVTPQALSPEKLQDAVETLSSLIAEARRLFPPTEQHRCQNCDAVWEEQDLRAIEDLEQRVEPGEPMPSGECPSCGCLCQPEEVLA